jgi:Na+-translocating ferredoxin:NAD+ oxidoreductase RnfG subunit
MKLLKIVLTLTFTVVSLTLTVYIVEGITSDIINEKRAQEIEDALLDIFPAINASTDEVIYIFDDFGNTGIMQIIAIVNDNIPKGYVYTVDFTGFSSTITYLIGVDTTCTITGFKVLSQGDTPGYGGQIADYSNWTQFIGMSLELAGTGQFEGLSGASITTGAWKGSLSLVYEYHLNKYSCTPLTSEQVLMQKIALLTGTKVEKYITQNPFVAYGIQAVYTDSSTQLIIYHVKFVGFNPNDYNEYIIAFNRDRNQVIGFTTIYSGDSDDYGKERMTNPANWEQFQLLSSTDLLNYTLDGFAGASITGSALTTSLQNVATYHRLEFEGIKELSKEERLSLYQNEMFPNATKFVDVTALKTTNPIIYQIYDVYDELNNLLGTLYRGITIGASYSQITTIEFLIGIDINNKYTGFYMIEDNETPGKTADYYEQGYSVSIIGQSLDSNVVLDAVSGATTTYDRLMAAFEEITRYHLEDYLDRPDSVDVELTHLQAAFPQAAQFETIYDQLPYDTKVRNIYEAKDESSEVLGYVYYAVASGVFSSTIEYTIGISNDATIQGLSIVVSNQTWSDANKYAEYDGSYGLVFSESTWLNQFTGVDIVTMTDNPIDSVAGVTYTTTGMINSIMTVTLYHQSNLLGGDN